MNCLAIEGTNKKLIAFANYFTMNSAVHLYNTRERENLHLYSVSTNYGKNCKI